MSPEATILVALFALVIGVGVGAFIATRAAADAIEQAAHDEANEPPRAPPAGIRERYLDELRPVAAALLESRDGYPADDAAIDRVARALSAVAAEAWGQGASELREAMVEGSGLPVEVVDDLCSSALARIERGRS